MMVLHPFSPSTATNTGFVPCTSSCITPVKHNMNTIRRLLSIPTNWPNFLSYTSARCSMSLWQSFSLLGYNITQLHTAAGMQTFSIINIILSKPEMNTRHIKLPAICHACMTSKIHLFSSWWHIQQFSGLLTLLYFFYGFPEQCRCCSTSQQTYLSMQQRCHATKKNEECVQNILFVHQPSTEKNRLSFSSDLNGFATTTSYNGQPLQWPITTQISSIFLF